MKGISFFLLVAVLAGLWLAVGQTGPAQAQQYPQVSNLTAFSPEANFMSLPGYLRWLVYQDKQQWISRDEAVRTVSEQMGMARESS